MGMTQFSLGRFTGEEIGLANETAVSFMDGLFFFKTTLALVGPSPDNIDRWVALANGRVRYPPWDLTLSVTGGFFRDNDAGIAVDLSRFFGTTEIGLVLRHTDNGSIAGIPPRVSLNSGRSSSHGTSGRGYQNSSSTSNAQRYLLTEISCSRILADHCR